MHGGTNKLLAVIPAQAGIHQDKPLHLWIPTCMGMTRGLILSAVLYSTVQADVITDGSLGAATNLSGPDFQIDASLGTQAGGTGNAGNIVINGNNRLDANESFISAESVNADGGNVNINTQLVVLDSSHIRADSAGANGGRLNIQATLVRTPDSTTIARGVAQDGEVLSDAICSWNNMNLKRH